MSGHSKWDSFGGSPAKVSDIPITRRYQIECADHGIVDEPKTFAEAIAARRDHFFDFHKERTEGGETP